MVTLCVPGVLGVILLSTARHLSTFDKCLPPCASAVPADPNVSAPCSLADVFREQMSVLTALLYECKTHPSVENRW